MKFGPVSPDEALGSTAVHSIRKGDLVLKKGTVIGAAEVALRPDVNAISGHDEGAHPGAHAPAKFGRERPRFTAHGRRQSRRAPGGA